MPLRKLPAAILLVALVASAQPEAPKPAWNSGAFDGLQLRLVGPAVSSGRVTSFAVNPRNKAHYFVGVASGGVWKTTNAGVTWTPVFDKQGSYSIGTVVMDPRNADTIWVGTGENNSQRSVGYGDGVYRSDDGGKTWRHLGLKTSEHVGRIAIDPRDSNIVYVASQGPLWAAGGERGLYKTIDGGKAWTRILDISENTGVTEIGIDPSNPDVLLAASYQRRRHVWTLINGGPESAIHKSTDGGKTWRKITQGLPAEEMGRIGLAFSPAKPGLVYARVEAANGAGGVFRSLDHGESWEKRNSFDELAMYYGQIIADPKNPDRIFVMNTFARVSDDGGRTLRTLGDRAKHIDTHTLWVDPNDTNYLLVGCDGGVYETWDGGRFWQFKANLPVTQFYDVTADNAAPFYNVCGGTQDNATWCGPSRTRSTAGITNGDWFVTVYGDGFHVRVDPDDPNTIYSEYQYAGLVRFDKRTGERTGIRPIEAKGEAAYRWNWDSPFFISPHNSRRLYFGGNRVFRSDDRGDSWRAISPDLTRQLDRDKLPVMGRVWGPDAVAKHNSTSFYSNITAMTESPKRDGLLYVGTDDGLVQVTGNGGAAWRRVESFPGVPERAYVKRLWASQHAEGTVYAAMDNHKNGDFKPYLLKSDDQGVTWTSIAGDLPANGSVLAFAEDHVNASLLFAGTEFGLYFSVDGGVAWTRLAGGGFPTIAVHDLAIQKRESDLVVGTFGRGIYILDDYSPLRSVTRESLEREVSFFPVKDAMEFMLTRPLGPPGKGSLGENFYTAGNPPYGAVFTYYLKDGYKTAKARRQEAQKEADKKKEAIPYPAPAELSREADEEAPAMVMTVTDAAGKAVRRLTGPAGKGFHRVAWNLRWPPPTLPPPAAANADEDEDDDAPPGGPSGSFVVPGRYTVTLAKRINGVETRVGQPQSFEVKSDSAALPRQVEFLSLVSRLNRSVTGALAEANALRQKLATIKRAVDASAAPAKLREEAAALETRLNAILRALRGDPELARRQELQAPSISDRVRRITAELSSSLSAPTRTHQDSYQIATEEFGAELKKLRAILDADVKKLERELDAAGVPHTPGRLPEPR